MLDLTKQFSFSDKNRSILSKLRLLLLVVFILLSIYVLYTLLFPTKEFTFDFSSPDANKNTISDPRNTLGELNKDGKLFSSDSLIFDTGISSGYSLAQVEITLNEDVSDLDGTITSRRGHRAFFQDQGMAMIPRDGSLFTNNNSFYLVSEGKLKKFKDLSTAEKFGWDQDDFIEITDTELSVQEKGESISFQYGTFPKGTLFLIRDIYYQLQDEFLHPYVSKTAFQTHHATQWALEKNNTLFELYPPLKEMLGFSDGTLISFGPSVYVVSGTNVYPIINIPTFEDLGYVWDDVIEANSEEFGLYSKTKIFTLATQHPEGTLFKTTEEGRYFLSQGGHIREVFGPTSLYADIQTTPIEIEAKSRENRSKCDLRRSISPFKTSWECTLPFQTLENKERSDYQFELHFTQPVKITEMKVTFKQQSSQDNFLLTLSTLRDRIMMRFTE